MKSDPQRLWGFVGVVISVEDLSASVWPWHQDGDRWTAKKVITIPEEPAEASRLPPRRNRAERLKRSTNRRNFELPPLKR